ncbi:thioesterase family protein [Pseudoruegeria sp. HB172150]|uniref:acyl-CoA thioesterase n=1 Tax=Pseudoruegeria sp. HB172150 TaxID=2721164 RepID=UPI0015527D54|nr:acyl-CoA thioesterase [Pseudoruegeria sp. HB172150]
MLSNTVTRLIEWGDCDPAGIVFNPNFFRWFDHCTTLLYEAAGWPKQVMVETFGIAGCPLVETTAKFLAPCRYGEEVEITSTIAEVRNSGFDIRHMLQKDGKVRVEGKETRVWTACDPETGRLKSAVIPEEVVQRFRGKPVPG